MSNTNIILGKLQTQTLQITSGATNGYVLTSDALGNASWSPQSVTGDTNFANTDLTFNGNRTHNTNNNYLWIQTNGTTSGSTIYMDSTNWIDVGFSTSPILGNFTRWAPTEVIHYYNTIPRLTIYNSETVINEDGQQYNFRIEGEDDQNLFFVKASTGQDNIGIGTNSPSEKLEVSGKTKTTNFQMTSGATNGYVLTSDASGNATWQTPTVGSGLIAPITMSWDGQGGFITTGLTRYFVVPYDCTISGWSIVSEGTNPTCTIDVWKITSGTSLPTNIDTITASAPPNLTTGNVIRSSTLTGWSTSLLAGDILGFNIDATNNALTIKINLEFQ